MPKSVARDRFQQLVDDISRLYADARQAQVRLAWETGRRIVEEEQDGASRAAFGARLMSRLSESLTEKFGQGFSVSTLKKMRQFYLTSPKGPMSSQLDWSDHVELLSVTDTLERRQLQKRVVKEGLTTVQLRALVRERQHRQNTLGQSADSVDSASSAPETDSAPVPVSIQVYLPLKRPSDLRFSTFARPLPAGDKTSVETLLVDCGFSIFWPQTPAQLKTLHLTDTPTYTYRAVVERVVDGDTLLVGVEAGFGIVFRTRLRLRGLNCPELSSAAGKVARDFVASRLVPGTRVALKTRKSGTDLYGRYLADVFYGIDFDATDRVKPEAVYLNQELIEQGLAVRMES